MKFTDHEGREVTVTFTGEPLEGFLPDPYWVDKAMRFEGDKDIITSLRINLSQDEVEVLQPHWCVPICKQLPRSSVLACAIPLRLTPNPEDLDDVDARIYQKLLTGRLYGDGIQSGGGIH